MARKEDGKINRHSPMANRLIHEIMEIEREGKVTLDKQEFQSLILKMQTVLDFQLKRQEERLTAAHRKEIAALNNPA